AERSGEAAVLEQARAHLADLDEEEREAHRDEAWRLARAGSAALRAGRTDEALASLERALGEAEAGSMPAAGRADLDYAAGHALLGAGRAADATSAFRRAVAG